MKKMWKLAVVALAAFAFVACSSPASKAEDFAQDLKDAGTDPAKIAAVMKECGDYVKDLDEKEAAEFAEAFAKKCAELGVNTATNNPDMLDLGF